MGVCEKVNKVEELLSSQTAIVSRIYEIQKALRSSVMQRDWSAAEESFAQIGALASSFSSSDKVLHSEITEGGAADFYSFTDVLPEEKKNILNGLYKTLKRKVLLSKYENDAFSAYVFHAKSLAQGMVDIIAETRSGSVYNHTGRKKTADMSSLVLNRVF